MFFKTDAIMLMKINIFQIALGLAIVIAMTISIAWDPTGFYARYMVEPGKWTTVFNPDVREVIATVLAYLVLVFALSNIGVSITMLIKRVRSEYVEDESRLRDSIQKLVVWQILTGFFIIVSAFLVSVWGFPTSYNFSISDNLSHIVSFMPGRQFMNAVLLSIITFILGIIMFVCGITQYLSSRHSRNMPDAT